MTGLEELIDTADKLSASLEKAASDEKKFCHDICFALEKYSWDMYRLANEIREIKEIYGG